MNEKNTGLGMIICLFIILILVLTIFGMWYYYNYIHENNSTISNNMVKDDSQSISNNNINTSNNVMKDDKESINDNFISKIYKDKNFVYTLKEGKAIREDGEECLYSLPFINIESEDAKSINNEIKELLDNIENRNRLAYGYMFNTFYNDNILSIVFIEVGINFPFYTTYNIDLSNGKLIDNREVILSQGISISEYNEILKDKLKESFIKQNENSGYSTENETYIQYLQGTVEDTYNYSNEIPMFLDEEGNITIQAKILSLVGSEISYHIIEIN